MKNATKYSNPKILYAKLNKKGIKQPKYLHKETFYGFQSFYESSQVNKSLLL